MSLDAARAQAIAERLYDGRGEARRLIDHVGRVAAAVPPDARVVAWLHEVFEHTAVTEEALLAEGLSTAELRSLRLLSRDTGSRSVERYLGHVRLIADARGPGAAMARSVKRADLLDRVAHPLTRADGWSPPYQLALEVLQPDGRAPRRSPSPAALGHDQWPPPPTISGSGDMVRPSIGGCLLERAPRPAARVIQTA